MKHLCLLIVLLLTQLAVAQEKCGTSVFNSKSSLINEEHSKVQFEDWLRRKMDQQKVQGRWLEATAETVYQIPVVIHVVHNGEALGEGVNIPDEQITNQIDSLNKDFRRQNADRVNTPAGFISDAADVKIEFVLAKRDPEGLLTDGIVRLTGSQSNYSIDEADILAANSYWPAEDYFNIWVADLSNSYLGFAKFPLSNAPGMDESPNLNRLIDGVFLDYEYFGTGFNADDFSKGRTLTHEVGHWLGLRHIWGDGGCSVDDFCNDTPLQGSSTSGCPETNQISCSSVDMIENFMDYTNDECMNLFTNCQSDRMRTVLENSPRRLDLLSSLGGVATEQVADDLGIRSIQVPAFGNCNLSFDPELEVRNYGTNDITSFSVEVLVDDEVLYTETFDELLTPLQVDFLNFPTITIATDVQAISFKINQVNGTGDGNVDNDCQWISTFFPSSATVPFVDDFTGSTQANSTWRLKNSKNNPSAWGFGTAANITADNEAAVLSYYGAPGGAFGELDYLLSPVFDLSQLATADLKFKYAYSGFPGNNSDALTVVVSTDCGATFPEENILFQKIGADLATTTTSSALFMPNDPSDWVEVEENFGQFANYSEVVLAFIGNNGGGNNLYIDDVEVYSSAANDFDIGIVSVESLPLVTCREDIQMDVYVKNLGKETITSFDIAYSFEGREREITETGMSLEPGKTVLVELESFNIVDGDYQLLIEIANPNSEEDEDVSNNSSITFFNLSQEEDLVPVREKFSRTLDQSDWHFIRPDAVANWEVYEVNDFFPKDYAAVLKCFEIPELAVENWIVSPILNFTETETASMSFDLSYANRLGRNDQITILGSTNCGRTYDLELYSKKGGELAVTQSEEAWEPATDEDWRKEHIILNELVGQDDARIAMVISNQNGNNIYLDNLEIYTTDDEPITIDETFSSFPVPASEYIEVKFNFNIKEEILIRVVGLDGEVVAEQNYPNTLNQIYRIENLNVTNDGMYLLQILGDFTNLSSKIYITK